MIPLLADIFASNEREKVKRVVLALFRVRLSLLYFSTEILYTFLMQALPSINLLLSCSPSVHQWLNEKKKKKKVSLELQTYDTKSPSSEPVIEHIYIHSE